MAQRKLGISMRGGGVRACTYLGFLKALEDNNIDVHSIIASSGGALVAAPYCLGKSVDEILSYQKKWSTLKMFSFLSFWRERGLIGNEKSLGYINGIIQNEDFENCKIKLFVQVTNLSKLQNEVFFKGEIDSAIKASSSFPIIVAPTQINNDYYVDGDLSSGFGADTLRESGAEVVIGLTCIPVHENKFDIFSEVYDSLGITMHSLRKADLKINPVDLLLDFDTHHSKYALFDYSKNYELFKLGYDQTIAKIDEIQQILN